MNDIVERLRDAARPLQRGTLGVLPTRGLYGEAADAIEQRDATIAQIRSELESHIGFDWQLYADKEKRRADAAEATIALLKQERDEARAEAERLKLQVFEEQKMRASETNMAVLTAARALTAERERDEARKTFALEHAKTSLLEEHIAAVHIQNEDAWGTLAELVSWKEYKERNGSDDAYERGKERAWADAKSLLLRRALVPAPARSLTQKAET